MTCWRITGPPKDLQDRSHHKIGYYRPFCLIVDPDGCYVCGLCPSVKGYKYNASRARGQKDQPTNPTRYTALIRSQFLVEATSYSYFTNGFLPPCRQPHPVRGDSGPHRFRWHRNPWKRRIHVHHRVRQQFMGKCVGFCPWIRFD